MYDNNKKESIVFPTIGADIYTKLQEQNQAIYEADKEKDVRKQKTEAVEEQEYARDYLTYANEAQLSIAKRQKSLQNIKDAFMTECLYKLYKESCPSIMTESDNAIARNLVTRFVKENGSGKLINNFATKNYVLSEFSRICKKYYNRVLNESDSLSDDLDATDGQFKELKLDNTVASDFYKELEDVDTDEASKLIKDRVSDAITDFIDSNQAARMDYEELIQAAKDQIDNPTTTEESAQYISNAAHAAYVEAEAKREKSLFHCIVEGLTKSVFKDPELKARYVHETTIDMESVVDNAELVYTMLEMLNTTNMVNVNEEYINTYLKALNK